MNVVQALGYVVDFIGAILGGFVSRFIALINMFRAVAYRKPDVSLFPHWWESPFNPLFRPAQLTDRGLATRRWCFYGVIGFVVCWVFNAVVSVATGVAH